MNTHPCHSTKPHKNFIKMAQKRQVSITQALTLALVLLTSAASAEEYDYYSWQSDNFHSGRFYAKQPQCVDIPTELRLCYNVGYKKMRLPNLLDHETMPEVKQQAGSWVPLLAKRCHADTQVFLCSLFAPVCLDRPIYPCRSLCEAVRDSCAPVMETYGFPWPEMLQCEKFPIDNDLCIPMQFAGGHATQTPGRTSENAQHYTETTDFYVTKCNKLFFNNCIEQSVQMHLAAYKSHKRVKMAKTIGQHVNKPQESSK